LRRSAMSRFQRRKPVSRKFVPPLTRNLDSNIAKIATRRPEVGLRYQHFLSPHPDACCLHRRNSLVCNMLSYVEFYQPKFFLLENVLGLLNHKLQINKAGPQKGNTVVHGVVKFILRALTSLGYVDPPPPRVLRHSQKKN
jgi:C-5 cytosine-specific DNA methylase